MSAFVHSFFNDTRVQILLLLIALDLVLGVAASIYSSGLNFRLSYLADFARNDLLGKVVPFAAIYAGYLYAKNVDIVIPGLDMQVIMDGMWAIVLAALVGSLLGSLKDFGISLPATIAGSDPSSPNP